jgi:hypothetical protein
LIDKYGDKKRVRLEDVEDDLIHTYKIKEKKYKKRLLINEADSVISEEY